jgi:hypothetical protein
VEEEVVTLPSASVIVSVVFVVVVVDEELIAPDISPRVSQSTSTPLIVHTLELMNFEPED